MAGFRRVKFERGGGTRTSWKGVSLGFIPLYFSLTTLDHLGRVCFDSGRVCRLRRDL